MTVARKLSRVLLALFAATAIDAVAAEAQEEINKQIAKLIGDAVSARVGQQQLGPGPQQAAIPAERNNIWGSYSFIDLDSRARGARDEFHSNLFIAGYDRDITNNVIVGLSGNRVRTNHDGGKGWGVSPYLAYRFSPSLFVLGKLNYQRTRFDFSSQMVEFDDPVLISTFSATEAKVDSYSADVSLNGVHRAGNLAAKGRVEVGFGKSDTDFRSRDTRTTTCVPPFSCDSTESDRSSSSSKDSQTTGLIDGEVGYFFVPGLYGFVGLQASTSDSSNSYSSNARVGLEKSLGTNAAVSLKYETRIDDNLPGGIKIDVDVFTIAFRARF